MGHREVSFAAEHICAEQMAESPTFMDPPPISTSPASPPAKHRQPAGHPAPGSPQTDSGLAGHDKLAAIGSGPGAGPAPVEPDAPAAGEVEDAELVARFRAGDRRAFDRIVERYQRPLFYLALRYIKNDADAADLTQRTFVRVFKSIEGFRGSSSFRTWIYRITINLCLNHIRDHRREHVAEIRDDALTTAPLGATRIIREDEAQELRAAIEELPPKQRMVLELRIYDELSFREVAALAKCSENAAKVNFHHAVKRLREIIDSNRQQQDEGTDPTSPTRGRS